MALLRHTSARNRLEVAISSNIKSVVFFVFLLLIGMLVVVNWAFLDTLKNKFREITDKEARLYAVAISEGLHETELNWAFSEILQKSRFPIIITDKYNIPSNWKDIRPGLLHPSPSQLEMGSGYHQLPRHDQEYLKNRLIEMDEKNAPLQLNSDGRILGYFHYGATPLFVLLSWIPLVELIFLALLVVVGYFGFQTIRTGEQSVLWVALAKETAHQMGTPLSSLMGWTEYLKQRLGSLVKGGKMEEIVSAIESDISRLNKVSVRFSQIGSLPELKRQSLNGLVQSTADYFQNRLPQLGKKVKLELKLDELPDIWLNRELMGWVLENLLKNALDSIQNPRGQIRIETHFSKDEQAIHLTCTDNGRGIDKENWKRVFLTGYSTKKRGWGLGLSLAKRIVNIYHSGDIFVEWSSRYHGTQFRIVLPLFQKRAKTEINAER